MSSGPSHRPRLLFLQWDHGPNERYAAYLLDHMRQHVHCLECFFEVHLVNRDCDFGEVCDHVQPDLVLFECGYRSHGSRRPKIRNLKSHSFIPRVGLHNGDSWCDRRAGLLADLEEFGIEFFFSICITATEYLHSMQERMYIWPNAIDPRFHRDYREVKTRDIHFSGQINNLYPWRQDARAELVDRFSTCIAPQIDYDAAAAAVLPRGETYARSLNASLIVPTCGTFAGELVRKHLEVPGCMACLLTEDTATLRQAGFLDMKNCAFANRRNIVDRVRLLLEDRSLTRSITEAGYALVHHRHTIAHRSQIYDWYMLQRERLSKEQIVQDGPFEALRIVSASKPVAPRLSRVGSNRLPLAEAYQELWFGDARQALVAYDRCLNVVHYLPEAKLGKAVALMRIGEPSAALPLLVDLIETTVRYYGAATPDPVEWACFLICLLCEGRLGEATVCAHLYPRLRHRELRLARAAVAAIGGRRKPAVRSHASSCRPRASIHRLPPLRASGWTAWMISILEAAGQHRLAAKLLSPNLPDAKSRSEEPFASLQNIRWRLLADAYLETAGLASFRPEVPPVPEFRYFRRLWVLLARGSLGDRVVEQCAAALARTRSLPAETATHGSRT